MMFFFMNSTANITLHAFRIENFDETLKGSNLYEEISAKLSHTSTIGQRVRLVSDEEDSDQDVLTQFVHLKTAKAVAGNIWRIAPSEDTPRIPKEFLEKNQITSSDIIHDEEAKNFFTRKSTFFFYVNNKNVLITNVPRTRIRQLKNYLNWLVDREDNQFVFTTIMKVPEGLNLNDITKIVISDNPNWRNDKDDSIQLAPQTDSLISFNPESLKGMFNFMKSVSGLEEIYRKNAILAKVSISFKKPKKMDDEEYKRLLAVHLSLPADNENIVVTDRNGNAIKSSEFEVTQKIECGTDEFGNIIFDDIVRLMKDFSNTFKI